MSGTSQTIIQSIKSLLAHTDYRISCPYNATVCPLLQRLATHWDMPSGPTAACMNQKAMQCDIPNSNLQTAIQSNSHLQTTDSNTVKQSPTNYRQQYSQTATYNLQTAIQSNNHLQTTDSNTVKPPPTTYRQQYSQTATYRLQTAIQPHDGMLYITRPAQSIFSTVTKHNKVNVKGRRGRTHTTLC
jgi:uncharacterized lipoprotein YbaY